MKPKSIHCQVITVMLACVVLVSPQNGLAQSAPNQPSEQSKSFMTWVSDTWGQTKDDIFSDNPLRRYLNESVIPEISKRFDQQKNSLEVFQKQVNAGSKQTKESLDAHAVDVQALNDKVSSLEKNGDNLIKSLAKQEALLNSALAQNQQLLAQAREREKRLHEMVKSDLTQQRSPDLAILYQQLYPNGEFLLGTTISGMAAALSFKKASDAQLLFRAVEHMIPEWSKNSANAVDLKMLTQLKAEADSDAAFALLPK